MEPRLKTDLWIKAIIKRCLARGIPATVARRGDGDAGVSLAVGDQRGQVVLAAGWRRHQVDFVRCDLGINQQLTQQHLATRPFLTLTNPWSGSRLAFTTTTKVGNTG